MRDHPAKPRPRAGQAVGGAEESTPWWAGGTLGVGAAGLTLAGRPVADLAAQHGTPSYLYDAARVRGAVAGLRAALAPFAQARIYYAIKANHFGPLLDLLQSAGIGIDACSPREVRLAQEGGVTDISVTASSLSPTDIAALAQARVHVNFDYVPALRRYAEFVPRGTGVGLRVDAGLQAGYGERTSYGAGKLGLAPEDVLPAAKAAEDAGLVIDTLHTHLGWGLRAEDESAFRNALATVAHLAGQLPAVTTINVGGGLGGRFRACRRK